MSNKVKQTISFGKMMVLGGREEDDPLISEYYLIEYLSTNENLSNCCYLSCTLHMW